MTSDAKIGLLLGLVFIFIIAFIINGLPNFRSNNNSELTTNMANIRDKNPALAAKERKAYRDIELPIKPVEKTYPKLRDEFSENQRDVRFEAPLPKSTFAHQPEKSIEINLPIAPSPAPDARPQIKKEDKINTAQSTPTKVYIVAEGDSLAEIAKKFYGPQQGNKKVNVDRIFKANSSLKSPDKICIGQKLLIPALLDSDQKQQKVEKIFPASMFEKVKSIGKRTPLTQNSKKKQTKPYIVKEGDSLWKIAAEQLGDGNRYPEIAELNETLLEYEDSITVGMRLKMPAR